MAVEILAPAGDFEKLKTAVRFGANAVYLAGKSFGLRAFAGNFDSEEMKQAVAFCHERGVKVYVTVNIYAKESDIPYLPRYLEELEETGVDAVLVSDPGIIELIHEYAPGLTIHLSTQASTTNSAAVRFWAKQGVGRIVLAREASLSDLTEITKAAHSLGVETEAFVHGAMCISYSGRCLMSDFLTHRGGNRGQCVQACRWAWQITEADKPDQPLILQEDGRGTYIMNSRDLNMIEHIAELCECRVDSLKIEGRMKSPFYVGTVVNAYRRAADDYYAWRKDNPSAKTEDFSTDERLVAELYKAAHRKYTTGFYYEDTTGRQYYESSRAVAESVFAAIVLGRKDDRILVEMRNRFRAGDELEVLSAGEAFDKRFVVSEMTDEAGNPVDDAKLVQQKLWIKCALPVGEGDILRTVPVCGEEE